jgi:amino-acid N-acetyltransferase
MAADDVVVRYARLDDAPVIAAITAKYARQDIMLERTADSVVEHIRNFFVAECNNEVIGCCAVAFYTQKLAEIRSLAVCNSFKLQGIGRILVEQAETVLREEGVTEVFVLTLSPIFFSRLGYTEIRKEYFPEKIWKDCVHCPKLKACDEMAMVKHLAAGVRVQPIE